jgi:hypothetical protein
VRTLIALGCCAAVLGGCGASSPRDASLVPRPVGDGPRFQPPARSPAVARATEVAGLGCSSTGAARYGAHVEVFAAGRVVVVPAGIGLAPPLRREGAYVRGARCAYPLMTAEPTGLVEIAHDSAGTKATLGTLFALWGQPLGAHRLAGFSGRVRVHVDGRVWRGDPRDAPLRPHGQVVVQVGPRVVPHARYAFPPGL